MITHMVNETRLVLFKILDRRFINRVDTNLSCREIATSRSPDRTTQL